MISFMKEITSGNSRTKSQMELADFQVNLGSGKFRELGKMDYWMEMRLNIMKMEIGLNIKLKTVNPMEYSSGTRMMRPKPSSNGKMGSVMD